MTLRRALLGALLIVALILIVGLVIAQDQETLRVRSELAAEDPRSLQHVASLVGTGVSSRNSFDVLENGDEIFPAMLEAIAAARQRISFETYIYEEGELADLFTAALAGAAERGVRVNLVVDAVGSGGMSEKHYQRLQEAGSHAAVFNEARWYRLEEVNYRTHRKLLIVDGEVAFTGGVGVADHWLGDAQDEDHWRDTMIRVRGPIVRLVEGAFYENFIESHSVAVPQLSLDVAPQPQDNEAIVVKSMPSGGSSDLKRLYLLTIAIARKTLDIQSPYIVTDESMRWALQDAVSRGVRVRLLMEGDETDALPVKFASRAAYDQLLGMGIELYEYQPTMMHAKVIVVDGIWSMFGSANFDNRSLELNDELNIAVMDRDLARRLTGSFEGDLQRSRRIELDAWRQRPVFERTREIFWSAFGEIF
jgi:cardiolipin synthase